MSYKVIENRECRNCGRTMVDTSYMKDDGPPPCDGCGSQDTKFLRLGRAGTNVLSTADGTRPHAPGVSGLAPILYNNKTYARDDWNNRLQRAAAAVCKPGETLVVESESDSARRTRTDENRQAAWENDRRTGVDDAVRREHTVLAQQGVKVRPIDIVHGTTP